MTTEQMKEWSGVFGKDYTDRNALSLEGMEELYRKNYGLSRTELNQRFLAGIDRGARILEVGSNVGNQLLCLQRMGFSKLYGIELQSYAVELSKSRTKNINIIQGEASDIPYKDSFFDVVFTSGVLIHISPPNLPNAMREIHRCTKDYIFGFEYYSEKPTEIEYRGYPDLLWMANFAEMYLELFDDLTLVRDEKIKYLNSANLDSMFLLRKS